MELIAVANVQLISPDVSLLQAFVFPGNGQRGSMLHAAHLGFFAKQTRRPWYCIR